MQDSDSFYPIKITTRSLARKRTKRISWFVVGTSFGIACTLMMSSGLTPQSWASAPKPAGVDELSAANKDQNSGLAITKGIDVVALALPTKQAEPAKAAKQKQIVYPLALNLKAEDGDTLITILTDAGVSYDEAQHAIDSLGDSYDPRRLEIGQNIGVVLSEPPKSSATPLIKSLRVPLSVTSLLELNRKKDTADADFNIKKINIEVERKLAHAGGRIDSSLYETGMTAGMPAGVIGDIINAYSYDVDFQRDIQPGDTMDVLFERIQTKEGVAAGHGNLLYAQLELSGREMKIYRYVDKQGSADYYNESGESIRKALLRTPVNGAKITSAFGMRNHPILGYSKMHRGVDFSAPTGTPIYAAGDGIVQFVGGKGGYGNYLRIHHNNKYDSAYAHISRFAYGIAAGRKVKQGQIVAYVGATGMATGPHLHYEILVNNEQINPANVKFKTGNVLTGKELAAFRKNMEKIEAQMANTPRNTDLAMAEP